MFVLITDGGFRRGPPDAQMIQVPGCRAKPVADIAHGLAFGKLAKQHRHQMRPARVAFLMFVGPSCLYELAEGEAI